MHAKKGEGAGGRRLARLGEGGGGVRGEGGHSLALGRAQGVEEAAYIPQRVEQAEQVLPVAVVDRDERAPHGLVPDRRPTAASPKSERDRPVPSAKAGERSSGSSGQSSFASGSAQARTRSLETHGRAQASTNLQTASRSCAGGWWYRPWSRRTSCWGMPEAAAGRRR